MADGAPTGRRLQGLLDRSRLGQALRGETAGHPEALLCGPAAKVHQSLPRGRPTLKDLIPQFGTLGLAGDVRGRRRKSTPRPVR